MQSQLNSKNNNANVPKLPNASKDPRNRKYKDVNNRTDNNTKMPVINNKYQKNTDLYAKKIRKSNWDIK